jgi:hypothetical protein
MLPLTVVITTLNLSMIQRSRRPPPPQSRHSHHSQTPLVDRTFNSPGNRSDEEDDRMSQRNVVRGHVAVTEGRIVQRFPASITAGQPTIRTSRNNTTNDGSDLRRR